jgi:hypothetical protein
MIFIYLLAALTWGARLHATDTTPKLGERFLPMAATFYGRLTAPETAVADQIKEFGVVPGVLTSLVVSVRARAENAFARHLIVTYGQLDPSRPDVQIFTHEGRPYKIERRPGSRFGIKSESTGRMLIDWMMRDSDGHVDCADTLMGQPAAALMRVELGVREVGIPVLAALIASDAGQEAARSVELEMMARAEYLKRARRYFNRLPDREFDVDHKFIARTRE